MGRKIYHYLKDFTKNVSMFWGYPLFLYVCLSMLLPIEYALYITAACTLVVTGLSKYYYSKSSISRASLGMNAVFISGCILSFLSFPRGYEAFRYLIVDHLLLLFVYLYNKHHSNLVSDLKQDERLNVSFRRYYRDSQLFFVLIRIFFAAQLLVAYIYLFGFKYDHTPDRHAIFLVYLRAVSVWTIAFIMLIRHAIIEKQLSAEVWLPIMNEQAIVIGKVAQSVSAQFKQKYLHPRVRVLVFQNEMIFMCKKSELEALPGVQFDTPVVQDMRFNQDFDECVIDLQQKNGMEKMPFPRFATRYLYKDKDMRRLMYLYTLQLPKEVSLADLQKGGGKLWSEKEIELNLGKGVFSKFFEEEFALLQATVFPIMKLMKKNG